MEKDFKYKEVETGLPAERALDVAATVANLVPLIGGPVASILSGISGGRKEERILEVIQGVSDDLRDFKSQAAEEYVKSEDFEELLENTLRRVAQERSSEKRQLYRRILTYAIKHPGGDYNEQVQILKTLDDLDVGHIVVLESQIEQLVTELNDRRIT